MKNLILMCSVLSLFVINSVKANETKVSDCSAFAESTERNGKVISETKSDNESKNNEVVKE